MASLAELLRDKRFREDVGNNTRDFFQSASNTAAANVALPIDAISWLLRKGGAPIPEAPVFSSQWAKNAGLMAEPKDPKSFASLLGDAAGNIAPMVGYAKAPEIAGGLNQVIKNANAPATLNTPGWHGQRGVIDPSVVLGLNTKKQLPADDIFAQSVQNTPGAKITNDGLLMQLARSQKPEQALNESVRGGVFYLPKGAAQAKHYSTGKSGYGGAEKISGETLLSNPLFVKGATGGKAPEAAFDQLMGKGAYQTMRNDAIKAYGGFGTKGADKVELAEKFLEKYAPEMQGMGYQIVANSKQGNQLAYALQEAAAGSAARRAGHDAILGYSKGKQGPFLSEVFDVREMNYPDKFGTATDIWSSFQK